MSEKKLRAALGAYADDTMPSVQTFPAAISSLAQRIAKCNHGPFPLCHGDSGHNNIIVDDDYNVFGVIDWEFAFVGPWRVFGALPFNVLCRAASNGCLLAL